MKLKTKYTTLFCLFAFCLFVIASSLFAAPPMGSVVPSVGSSDSSVNGVTSKYVPTFLKLDSSAFDITITPVLLPVKESSSWTAAADKLIADAKAGTIQYKSTVSVPTDYAVCVGNHIDWQNTIFSQSTTMWAGQLNPIAPFDHELGQVIWQLVDVKSTTGGNDISLSMLGIKSVSNDGNVLGDLIGFQGLSYSARAILIKSDGSIITDGADTQLGNRVIVITFTKLFNGGATQAGLYEVRDWITPFADYTITYTVTAGASSKSITVSTKALPPVAPVVKFDAVSGLISINNSEPSRLYQVQSSTNLPGNWTNFGTITGTNTLSVAMTNNMQFFKVLVVP